MQSHHGVLTVPEMDILASCNEISIKVETYWQVFQVEGSLKILKVIHWLPLVAPFLGGNAKVPVVMIGQPN